MPPTKPDTPAVTTYADYEVITPPNKLRKAVAAVDPSAPDDDPVARAEQALAQLSPEFAGWMETDCARLDAARALIKSEGINKKNLEELFHAAHDIKGEAATFGFPAVAGAADSLCRLIEHSPEVSRIPTSLIEQHVDAVRAITREYARSDATEIAGILTKRLREVTDEFLVFENKDRPDYLDGIVGPPLAPGEI
jgi:HPt (histidine-containing phosphotransfer) domain-containing protein